MGPPGGDASPAARLLERRAGGMPRRWDGAIGTELIALGLDLGHEPPEAWNLSWPQRVAGLAARYVAAGAEVVQTNTFGASRPRLLVAGLAGEIGRIHRMAVSLARQAGARFVVASLGPTGLDPVQGGAASALHAAYAEQVGLLSAAGVDGLHFETLLHPAEALAAIAAAREIAPGLPVIASTTCALGDHGFQTPLGVPLGRMAAACEEAGADALGLNCSLEARKLLGAVRALREQTELPIVVQPQGGEPSVGCKGDRRGDTPERFAEGALRLVEAGADAIGGCCGAGPEYIAALARRLDERFASAPPGSKQEPAVPKVTGRAG